MQIKKVKPPTPAAADDNQLGAIFIKYLAFWPLFIISLVLCMAGGYYFIKSSIPQYEATATLIIKDEKKGNDYSKTMEDLDIINVKKISENEVEVLQSRTIMDNVVKKLGLYAGISVEGKLKALSAYVTCPVRIEFAHPDKLKTKPGELEKIYFDYFPSANKVVIKNRNIECPLNEFINTPYGELKFVLNEHYKSGQEENAKYYFSIKSVKDVTKGILTSLKVSPTNKLSSILNLTYRDQVPERAEDILNELLGFYREFSVAEKNNLAKNTIESIEERLRSVKTDLDSIEGKIQSYKTTNSAVELNNQSNLYLQSVSSTDKQLGEVNVQLSVLNDLEKYVANPDNNVGILPSAVGLSDPNLTQLIANLNQAQNEREKLRKTVAENNPLLLTVNDQIARLRPNILANIQNLRRNLETSRNNLAGSAGKYSSMLSYIPSKERELIEISRDRQSKSDIYAFLLKKREETELSYVSTPTDSRVVNPAQAGTKPVSPQKPFIYLGAFLLGLILPIVIVNAKELANSKVLYRNEIEKFTSIPVIAELALDKSKKPLALEAGKRTFTAEQFRKIRISLLYLGIEPNHKKKVLLTSSIPGEGKSFISSNLALSLASTGKKVVLVDMDLHNSSLGRIFNMEEEKGVSDYLNSNYVAPDDIIRQTDYENLHFINAGTLLDNPTELLTNGRIEQLISYLEHNYDLVIMDTAPIVFVTDAFLLTNLADATLFVVRHNHTPKLVIKRLDEKLIINPLHNPAIIFNGIKTRGFMKNNYGYGYDYVYGKGNSGKKY
ncbi:MAG: hypothetical protein RLY16_2293 [Bacteroidota bacterium]|jgi:capsular exopolysaccharide synthesis family protein